MAPNIQRLDLAENIMPDTNVTYEAHNLNGYTDPAVRAFHEKLMQIGRVPHGLLMRYGMNPLQTYAFGGEQLRERMRLAFQSPLNIHARLNDNVDRQ